MLEASIARSADTTIPNGFRSFYPLPSQVDPVKGQKTTKAVNKLTNYFNSVIFIVVVLALLFEFQLDMLWSGINTLQIVCCMSYCNVAWPANIGFLFTMLNGIAQFEILNPFNRLQSNNYNDD